MTVNTYEIPLCPTEISSHKLSHKEQQMLNKNFKILIEAEN